MANKLKELREARGETLQTVGDATGIDPSSLSRWENGLKIPAEPAMLLALYFCVPLEAFYSPPVLPCKAEGAE